MLSKETATAIKDLAMLLRRAAYHCGAIEHEDKKDNRPVTERGSTHEEAIRMRKDLDQASADFINYVETLARKPHEATPRTS